MAPPDLDRLVAPDGSWVERSVVTDAGLHELEMENIFGRAWLLVGHESQIPEPGDYVTSCMGEDPVIVARGRDRSLHVMLNSCSHRGSLICRTERGNAKVFTCTNHGWEFSNDGRFLGAPQISDGYGPDLDRTELGLASAASVETYHGLIFATFDPDHRSLTEYLGDATYYLDTIFGRYPGGMEVLGGVQRVVLESNWKLAAENLGTDLQHPEVAHGAFMDIWPDPVMAFMKASEQVITSEGHPMCIGRRRPPQTEAESMLPTIADPADREEAAAWYLESERASNELLGQDRDELYVFTGSVYPNMSFLPGVAAIYLCHPRGPRAMEWWSWCVVPKEAPPGVKDALRKRFHMASGPGGLILAEDAENWMDMTRSSASAIGRRRRLHVGRGVGEEYDDDVFPGRFAPMRSEHVQRGFWLNWRRTIEK